MGVVFHHPRRDVRAIREVHHVHQVAPAVFESLYLRLPGTRAGEVEFVHIDRLAWQVCAAAGDRQTSNPRDIEAAFATAYKRKVFPGTPLAEAGFSRQYLRDEVTSVIKGRAIDSLDTYLEIARTGRRAPMGRQQRSSGLGPDDGVGR